MNTKINFYKHLDDSIRLKKILSVPAVAKKIYEIFKKHHFLCFAVGGFVRNALLGKENTDIDFTTNATPEQMLVLFPRAIPTGIAHGTLTIVLDGQSFEITTFRSESTYSDARHPDKVFFSSELKEDVLRRDFTVNALAYDIDTHEIIDYVGGLEDLQQKKLRAIGDASERFKEDALRMMRVCRFVSQLQFCVDIATKDALKKHSCLIDRISAERVHMELSKLLLGSNPSNGLEMMRESGLLSIILPEVAQTIGVDQNSFHSFDVYGHTLHVVDRCRIEYTGDGGENTGKNASDGRCDDLLKIVLAALFHDVGKVKTRKFSQENKDYTFYGHENISVVQAKFRLEKLRYSNRVVKEVCHLIKQHMIQYHCDWSDAAVRRFIRRVDIKMLKSLFYLARADRFGKAAKKNIEDEVDLLQLEDRIRKEIENHRVFSIKDLKIGGCDLMQMLKLDPSKKIGEILCHLLEIVLEDPQKNTKDQLIEEARSFLRETNAETL